MPERLKEKYSNRPDLHKDDEFWSDVEKEYKDFNVVLPLEYLPENVRMLQGMLHCPPGVCGECCRYQETPVWQYDLHRMMKVRTLSELQDCVYTRQDGSMYMGPCPFLQDGACSIYQARPDVCWLFPIQKGAHKGMIRYRLKCHPAVQVVRKIFTAAVKDGKHILLPNLTLTEV